MSLSTCPSCEAFVPLRASSCPSCGSVQPLVKRIAKVATLAAISSSFVTTLMACYGVAAPPGDGGRATPATTNGPVLDCDLNGDGDCSDPGETARCARPPRR